MAFRLKLAMLFAVTVSTFAAAQVVQARRAMTIHDLIVAVRVGDPRLSPDGKTVAYVRTTTDAASGRRDADIWQVPVAGGEPRVLLRGDGAENTPRWLPDGGLLFISTRSGEPQIYRGNANGGDVRQITRVAGGVQPPLVVSPDGRLAAFVVDVYPDCADDACNRQRRDAADKNPVKVHTLTRLLFRHWDEWREDVRHHIFVTTLENAATAHDITPGDFDSPPGQQEDGAIAFSATSASIAFVSNREGNDREAWTTNNDVFVVPVAGGTARKITANPAADVQPVFTPDGRSLVVRAQRRPGFESDRFRLDVYDLSAASSGPVSARRTVFETPDLSVDDFQLDASSQQLLFTATDHATDNLYRVPLAGGPVERVAKGGGISGVNAGSSSIVFLKSSLTAPAEVYTMPGDGGTPVQLTRENAGWLKDLDVNAPESLTVAGAGATPIQYWVLKPPAFDPSKKYPVVILIHGGPQGAWGDSWSARWNPALWAAQGWVIVAPNPRGSTGFGQKFVDDISRDWNGKVMQDLNAVFDAAIKLPYVDATKQGIAGASYGGYAVDWIIGHTNRFKAAVTHDGVYNLESISLATEELWFSEWEAGGAATSAAARETFRRSSPHLSGDRIRTPTLVITNELDFRVPVEQGLQLFTTLRRNGVPSKALVFPDEGHWVLKAKNSERWHEEVFAWMKQYLR